MNTVLKRTFLLFLAIALSFLFANAFGSLYDLFVGIPRTLGIANFISDTAFNKFLAGVVPAYIFFVSLLFTIFELKKKKLFIVIFLLPSLYFIYFDLSHFWFYFLIALVGWGIGFVLNQFVVPYFKKDTSLNK